MTAHENHARFVQELEETLETACYKDPDAFWTATVQPWWQDGIEVLRRQGYACELGEPEPGVRRLRVWNPAIGWSSEAAAELVYCWDAARVTLIQRIAASGEPHEERTELPINRLTSQKARDHLRHFVKDVKAYVGRLPEPGSSGPNAGREGPSPRRRRHSA